jgi:hypothetical protein
VVRRAEEADTAGAVVLGIDFGDHRDGFPWRMDVRGGGTTASLRYTQMDLNVAVDPVIFTPPPAARVLSLDRIEVRR